MDIAVYSTEEDADKALGGREKYINAMSETLHYVFYHEGDMDFAHLNET